MRIDLRDITRQRLGHVEVDPAQRPTRVRVPETDREVFLTWEAAVDDAGHLRRCVVCGCPDLFTEKSFPQATGFIVFLAFVGAILGALGFARTLPVLTAMAVILALDVGILVLARRRLVCYRCRTAYRRLPIARYHRSWDRSVADRHPAPRRDPGEGSPDRRTLGEIIKARVSAIRRKSGRRGSRAAASDAPASPSPEIHP